MLTTGDRGEGQMSTLHCLQNFSVTLKRFKIRKFKKDI
jgi:hypothetical protein